MSYLAGIKRQLRDTVDQAFGYLWQDVEAALKGSYKSGFAAGQEDAKERGGTKEPSPAGPRRQWRRGKRPAATEGGDA